MTFDEYQALARRTQNPALKKDETLLHALFGMCSEVGEIQSMWQHVYQGEEVDGNRLNKEIGDVLWFIAELCDAVGVNMSDVAQLNIDKLKKRYPEGFDAERSVNRTDR